MRLLKLPSSQEYKYESGLHNLTNMFLESLVRLEAVCARAHIEQAEYALRVRLICAQMFFLGKIGGQSGARECTACGQVVCYFNSKSNNMEQLWIKNNLVAQQS